MVVVVVVVEPVLVLVLVLAVFGCLYCLSCRRYCCYSSDCCVCIVDRLDHFARMNWSSCFWAGQIVWIVAYFRQTLRNCILSVE